MSRHTKILLSSEAANIHLANQEILELAKGIDPEGDRTLGVLTKPDLVDKGTEPGIMALVEGRADKLKLGWHLVRNPGQSDLNDITFDRLHPEKEFFRSKAPWSALDFEKVGMDLLRVRLREVLSKLVRKEFSKVKLEVNRKLSAAQDRLGALGPERDSRPAQVAFLTDLSTRFQELARLALDAKQGHHKLFEKSASLRIAPTMVDRMKEFKVEMSAWGHRHAFKELAPPTYEFADPASDDFLVPARKKSPKTFNVRKQEAVDDLGDLLHEQKRLSTMPSEDIDQWLQELHQDNKGFELGTFDPAILFAAMRKQCVRWPDICLGFVSDAVILTHNFITAALEAVCRDERIYTALYSFIVEDLRVDYTKAIEQANFLIQVETEEMPWTEDHYFNEYLDASRKKNWLAKLQDLSVQDSRQGRVVSLENLRAHDPMGNSEFLVRDIHDILHSYYTVTQKRIVDNICK
ncbi:hypothetical protein LTR49_025541 [Elasticomyces elasticus]|nr:hypothetical protein LTR49_025541 [Elasticomyces elasticus]